MAEWVAKRFWKTARSAAGSEGWRILLDMREVRTPAGRRLLLPTRALADAITSEWEAQGEVIDPGKMPFTRMANSALDKVAPQHADVVATLSGYSETDLLSYRADRPDALAAKQAELWDPLLDWAADRFGARLTVTRGVMPVIQPAEAVEAMSRPLSDLSPFRLAAFHDFVVLTGSIVLANAMAAGRLDGTTAWSLSRVDEAWQEAEWGRDAEAEAVADRKLQDLHDAERFWTIAA